MLTQAAITTTHTTKTVHTLTPSRSATVPRRTRARAHARSARTPAAHQQRTPAARAHRRGSGGSRRPGSPSAVSARRAVQAPLAPAAAESGAHLGESPLKGADSSDPAATRRRGAPERSGSHHVPRPHPTSGRGAAGASSGATPGRCPSDSCRRGGAWGRGRGGGEGVREGTSAWVPRWTTFPRRPSGLSLPAGTVRRVRCEPGPHGSDPGRREGPQAALRAASSAVTETGQGASFSSELHPCAMDTGAGAGNDLGPDLKPSPGKLPRRRARKE